MLAPLAERLPRCKRDPSRFNEAVLCRGPLWARQEEICDAVVNYTTVLAPAGNCVGKSRVASSIVWWFGIMHPDSRVVIAAPTIDQLTNVLWAEMLDAYKSAAEGGCHLGGKFDGLSWRGGERWTIEGWGKGSVESKSGRHAGALLAIIDEASGAHESVMEAIDSLNPSLRLFLGNPLRPEGKFFDLCLKGTTKNQKVIKIPSLESPHIGMKRSPWGLADATWLEERRDEYGEDSQWWQSHVLANFPGELESTLLPWGWLHEASKLIHVRKGPVRIGVDLAKGTGGDDSQITARDDNGVIESRWSNRWDLEETAKQVRKLVDELREKGYSVSAEHITFDATGLGVDFGNRLLAVGLEGARGYQGANLGGPKFVNLRSAAGWYLRRRLDPERAVAPDPKTGIINVRQAPFSIPEHLVTKFRAELQGARYALDATTGKIALEPKDEFVKRLKKSPNFLDSLLMTFAYPHS